MSALRAVRALGFLALLAALSACAMQAPRVTVNLDLPAVLVTPVPDNPPPHGFDLDNGARIFMSRCAACHGPLGLGDGSQSSVIRAQGKLVANLVDKAPTADPVAWYRLVGKGNLENLMPGFSGSLSAQERWDVTQYAIAIGAQRLDRGNQTLSFRLANQTAGGAVPTSQPVILRAYIGPGLAFSRTAIADAQGVAVFAGLAARDFIFYQAEANYRGARFFSEPQQITQTAPSALINLPIFEVTSDPAVLSISGYQFIVDGAAEGTLSVLEAYSFQNSGDRAYVAADTTAEAPRSVAIPYPTEGQNLRFEGAGMGERFVREGDVLRDMDAVLPGAQTQVVLFYDLPYRGEARLERRMTAPLKRWEIILPDGSLRAAGLADLGAQTVPGLSFPIRRFGPAAPAAPVAAGQSVVVALTGQPRGAPDPGADPRAIGVGFILFAVGLAAGYILFLRARWAPAFLSRDALIAQLAALDDAFAAGKLAEPEYRRRRAALKGRLRAIWPAAS